MNNPNNVKVGSQVRFLNAVGGGRVARITADTAWVEDADGFEIPTLLKECVVVDAGDTFIPEIRPPQIIQEKLQKAKPEAQTQPEVKVRPSAPKQSLPQTYRPDADELTATLAFLPQDRTKLGLTNYEAYLINYSNFSLYFAYLSAVGTGYKLRASGVIEPHSDAFLEEFAPAELNDLEQLAVQILPFSEQRVTKLQHPLSVRLRLDTTKFFKLHSFRENDYFTDEALMIPIVERGAGKEPPAIDPQALEQSLKAKKVAERAERRPSPSSPQREEPLVVDLHASNLLETTAGMSSADIHAYQLEYFHRTMREHLKEKGRKIIFIHGKGDGILRSSIERELKHKYPTCRYQDASFREYGFGATQVTVG